MDSWCRHALCLLRGDMKRYWALLAILGSLFLVSCISLSNRQVLPSGFVEPLWFNNTNVAESQQVFIGTGFDPDEQQAGLSGMEDILSEIDSHMEFRYSDSIREQFLQTGSVEDIGLQIIREEVQHNGEGLFGVFIFAVAEKELLDRVKGIRYEAMSLRKTEIQRLITLADDAYRNNRDIETIAFYLQAAALAWSLPIDEEALRYETLYSKVNQLISDVRLSVSRADSASATWEVELRRKGPLLWPHIRGVQVQAVFTAQNGQGGYYQDSSHFTHASGYSIEFSPPNAAMIGEGEVWFFLDLDEELKQFELAVGTENALELRKAVEETGINVTYRWKREILSANPGLLVMEFDGQGTQLESRVVETIMSKSLEVNSCNCLVYRTDDDDDIDLLESFSVAYPTATHMIICRVGLSEVIKTGTYTAIIVGGTLSIYDVKSGVEIHRIDDVTGVAWNQDPEIAHEQAFAIYARAMVVRMLTLLK